MTGLQGRKRLNVVIYSTSTSECAQECPKHCLGLVPCCLAPDMQKKYVSESSSASTIVAWWWEKELCQSFMPEEFSFCCCQGFGCSGWCLQLEQSNCRQEGKFGPMSKQTISYNLHSWVQARRCEDMQQASLRAYPEKAHGSKLPGSHWYKQLSYKNDFQFKSRLPYWFLAWFLHECSIFLLSASCSSSWFGTLWCSWHCSKRC